MATSLDLSEIGVVDAHCHGFLPEKEEKPFEAYLTLSDMPQSREDLTSTILYRLVMRELSRVLGIKGEDEIIKERKRRIKSDPEGYIRMLFDDARIDTLLVDTGYPFREYIGYGIDIQEFSEMVGREAREIFRLEVAVYGLVKGLTHFDEATEDFRAQINDAVAGGDVALKSVIAYRTGLAVQKWEATRVKQAWNDITSLVREGKSPRELMPERNERNKAIYDHFLRIGIQEAAPLKVPVQIHTGMGDSPSMDLRIANPAQLYDLLNDEEVKKAKIVLTHGGYPYLEEASFLVNAYPNVHLDLSETIPFTAAGVKNRILNLLEMAPTTKIMYGSDGFNIPETHWFAAVHTKHALATALGELIQQECLHEKEAEQLAHRFLHTNAEKLYQL
jgi:hypothetical protein